MGLRWYGDANFPDKLPKVIDENKFPKDKALDKKLPRIPDLGDIIKVPFSLSSFYFRKNRK